MNRRGWIIAGVVGLSLVIAALAMTVPPTDMLCNLAGVIGPGGQANDCGGQVAEVNAAAAQARVLLFALWVGGLIVAAPFLVREVAAARAAK